MATTFKQGEDQKIELLVIADGTALDMSDCTNIKAILKVNNLEQKKYALISETDHGMLEVDGTVTNKINLFVEREESRNFPVGAITIIVLASFPDTEFGDGVRTREFKFAIGRVAQGEGINENI